MTSPTYLFVGTKPAAVLFGDERVEVKTWRQVYAVIIGRCNENPQHHERLMYLYTKSIAFGDLNYHLAQPDDKTTIFEGYGDFLNYFDSSLGGQISCVKLPKNIEDMNSLIQTPVVSEENAATGAEFSGFLHCQQSKGNNGMEIMKFATFAVEADNFKAAKLRAERVETDVLNNLTSMGSGRMAIFPLLAKIESWGFGGWRKAHDALKHRLNTRCLLRDITSKI